MHFDAVPVNVDQNSITRIPVTITVDKAISHEKIFLSVTYVGTDLYDNLWRSAWGNTITLDIAPKEKSFPPCISDREACFYQDKYMCDPAGWECSNTRDVFSKVINSPLKQLKSGIPFLEIKCKKNLELIYKNNGSPVCVKPETKTKLIERGWGIETYLDKIMEVHGTDHFIKYGIERNATVTDIIYNNDSASIIITLDVITSDSLTVELPRNLIDSGHSNCGPNYEREEPFAVLIDHEEVLFEEIVTTSEKRTLLIPFQENTKEIEIIAFCLI